MILDANMLHNQLNNIVKHVAYQSARTGTFLNCNNFPTLFRIEKKREKKTYFRMEKRTAPKKKKIQWKLALYTEKNFGSLSFPKTHPKHSLPNIFICKLTKKKISKISAYLIRNLGICTPKNFVLSFNRIYTDMLNRNNKRKKINNEAFKSQDLQ